MESGLRHPARQVVLLAASVCGFLVLSACLVSYVRWGGVSQGLAWLRGEAVDIVPRVWDAGDVAVGHSMTGVLRIQNLKPSPVAIVGATSLCPCTSIKGMPLELPASGSGQLSVQFRPDVSQVGQVVEQQIPLHLSVNSAPLVLVVRARVVPASAKGQP